MDIETFNKFRLGLSIFHGELLSCQFFSDFMGFWGEISLLLGMALHPKVNSEPATGYEQISHFTISHVLQAIAVLCTTASVFRKLREQYTENVGYNDPVCYHLPASFTALSSRVSKIGARQLWMQRSLL